MSLISDPELPAPPAPAPPSDAGLLDAYSRAVTGVVDVVGPAVVAVRVRHPRRRRRGVDHGSGSGFVVAPDGFLITNSHVVRGAASVRVAFPDGEEAAARVVGDDPATDLALLQVARSGLPHVRVPEAATPRPGQLVVAIGNPFGFQSTVSAGVLSATDRVLAGERGRPLHNLLQHTAALNPGNSGGPLVASDAVLLGVNTAMLPVAQGIGFAVPAATVSWVLPRLFRDGRVERSFLGIVGRTDGLPRGLAAAAGVAPGEVVRVETVESRGPAAKGGVRAGDRIAAADGTRIVGIAALQRFLADWAPDRPLELRVVRDETPLTLRVIPGAS